MEVLWIRDSFSRVITSESNFNTRVNTGCMKKEYLFHPKKIFYSKFDDFFLFLFVLLFFNQQSLLKKTITYRCGESLWFLCTVSKMLTLRRISFSLKEQTRRNFIYIHNYSTAICCWPKKLHYAQVIFTMVFKRLKKWF